jgi:hypothetical protein
MVELLGVVDDDHEPAQVGAFVDRGGDSAERVDRLLRWDPQEAHRVT